MTQILPARIKDIPRIRALYKLLFTQMAQLHPRLFLSKPPQNALLREFIRSNESDILLYRDACDEIQGLVTLVEENHPSSDFYVHKRFCYLSDIVVSPTARSSGIGHALMEASLDWARARGLKMITLDMIPGNVRAKAFYEREGFSESLQTLMREV